MKKIFVLPLAIMLAGSLQFAAAQEKLKEGKITYEISYPESEEMNDQMLAMMPKDMTVWFKGDKSRGEMKMGYGSTVSISDKKTKETITCLDMMGKKNAIKTTAEEAEKEKEQMFGEYEVKITDETRKIAGYTCKRAEITFKNGHEPMDIWFTDQLEVTSSARYKWKGIDGVTMESTMEQKGVQGNIKMKMTCTKVEKVAVSDDQFNIPEGFKVTTREEMMKEFKQGEKVIGAEKDSTQQEKK